MNLCIDIGNTRVKTAVFDQQNKLQELEISLDFELQNLAAIIQKYGCTAAIVSSVRTKEKPLEIFLKKELKTVLNLKSTTPIPIQNDYQTPQTLGKDRLAAVVGATALLAQQNVLVVDAGTCITYDFVTKQGVYKGGSILPGIVMRFESMAHFTAQLPLVKAEVLTSFVGTTTPSSMQTGVLYGVLHELRGFRKQYEAKFGTIQVIVTGGDTTYFESQFKNEIFAQPNLVLVGLNKILNYNLNL